MGRRAATALLLAALLAAPAAAYGTAAPPDTLDAAAAQAQKLFVRGLTHAYLDEHNRAIGLYERALELAPNEAPILSALADAQAEQNAFETAIFYAQQARTMAPDNAHYYRQLATLHREQDNPEAAIEVYRALVDRFPQDADAQLELGRLLSDAHRADEAILLYESVEQQMGQATPQMYMQMLQLYRRLNDSANVERVLQHLVELRPDERLFMQLLGQYYLKEDQTEQAIRLYEQTLADDPADLETALELATLYREQGRAAEADSLMQAVSDTDGASADQLVRRARALYRQRGASDEAMQQAARFLEQALERHPDHEDALQMLGDLRYDAGQFAEAARLLTRSTEQNPRVLEHWIKAAAAHLEAGAPERAAEVADEGLLLFPGQVPLVQIAARSLFELNRNRAALDQYETLRDLLGDAPDVPTDRKANVHAMLGLLYDRVGDAAASDQAYENAIALDDRHALALNNLAYSLAQRGVRLDEAQQMAERAVAIDADNASYLDTLGWVFFQQGAYETAATWLKRALDTGEATATVYEHYGDVQKALGNSDAARTYWQQALDRAPNRDALRSKLDALSN